MWHTRVSLKKNQDKGCIVIKVHGFKFRNHNTFIFPSISILSCKVNDSNYTEIIKLKEC